MAKLIDLPNGAVGEFPDDMDDGAIAAVLRKQFPKNDSAEGMSATERFMTGVGGAAARVRDQIFPPGSPVDALTMSQTGDNGRQRKDDLATYEQNKDALGTAGTLGEIAGEVALTAGPLGKSSSLGGAVLKKTLGRMAPAAADIAANAGYAGMTAEPGQRGTAAMIGGAGAAGGRVLTRTLGGVARPFISKDAQTLIDRGVRPTPGQLFGDGPIGSTLRGVEDRLTSVPLVGDVVGNARRRSISEYGNAEINAALKPLGATVRGSGMEAVEQAHQAITASYERVLPQIFVRPSKLDSSLAAMWPDIDSIPLIRDEDKGTLMKYAAQKIMPALREATESGQPIPGQVAKQMDTELGYLARKFSSAPDPQLHPLGEAMYTMQAGLRDAFEGTTPEATKLLSATNNAYRQLLPVLKAADRTQTGQFTPRQLDRASGQYNQQPSGLSRAGQNVLPSTVPDSGTAGRTLTGLAIGGAGGAATGALPSMAMGAALAAAVYSGPGIGLLVNGLRGFVPDKVLKGIASLPPSKQRSALQHMAATIPAVGQRVNELAPQIGRALATQGQE